MVEEFSFLMPKGWNATYNVTHDGSGGAPNSMDLPQYEDKKEKSNAL